MKVRQTENNNISYDGKIFTSESNTPNGEVSEETLFYYHQDSNVLWANYYGGEIVRGYLIGTVSDDSSLDFYYQHINKGGELRVGKCHSTPHMQEDGKLKLYENWKWLDKDQSVGSSIVIEV